MFQAVVEEKDDQLVLTVPPEVQREFKLQRGDCLQVEISAGPSSRRGRFAPGQLLREHAEILDELGENREWVNAPSVGREVL